MKRTYITIFYLDGEYHSTQDKKISYDWAITGAVYEVNNIMYVATVTSDGLTTEEGHTHVKQVILKPQTFITL